MILYYALGGGLGHITRARAVLHTLYPQTPAVILCSSLPVQKFPVPDGVRLQVVPGIFARDREAYRTWLMQLFVELQPQAFFLDTFPAGIVGEFCDFPVLHNLSVHYVARRLRWSTYGQQIGDTMPMLQTTFCLEPLEADHQKLVARCSTSLTPLSLVDPPCLLSDSEYATVTRLSRLSEPFWLIAHAGSHAEVRDLIAYAEEMRRHEESCARLVVATPEGSVPSLSISEQHLGFFPAQALFPFAERIISACGFNVIRQMAPFRQKHHFMPFDRRFDDQYWRAAYWREHNNGGTSDRGLQFPFLSRRRTRRGSEGTP